MSDGGDRPIGRVLTRRETLALLGATGLVACAPGALASPSPTTIAAAPSCIVRPALTEGPYFVDEKLDRSDIRAEPSTGAVKPGVLLALTFNVSRVSPGGCAALPGAQVDIWHCDALGLYSDAADPTFNTRGQKFLRGFQRTDAAGRATFTTVYPGWYGGRAVHIHFKIRTAAAGGAFADFTSQFFFEDSLNAQVFAQPPYAQRGQGWLPNARDGIFGSGGDKLLLKATPSGSGYAAAFDIGLA